MYIYTTLYSIACIHGRVLRVFLIGNDLYVPLSPRIKMPRVQDLNFRSLDTVALEVGGGPSACIASKAFHIRCFACR